MSAEIPAATEIDPSWWIPKRTLAAMRAAERRGVSLAAPVAEAIAEAVLECADDEHRVRMQVAPEMWPQARDVALERLGVQMARDLVAKKLLPTSLPREVVQRGRYDWDVMTVELVVPVRKAPAQSG